MGTISSAFSLISSALDADQSALGIVANNVANANTPGYTREIPNWSENPPVEINGIRYGTGVTQTGAISVRDRVLTARLDQQQQLASASSARLAALDTMQTLFKPNTGASTANAGDLAAISLASSVLSLLWRQIRPTIPCASKCSRPVLRWPQISPMRHRACKCRGLRSTSRPRESAGR
jgi:hypothetical protein